MQKNILTRTALGALRRLASLCLVALALLTLAHPERPITKANEANVKRLDETTRIANSFLKVGLRHNAGQVHLSPPLYAARFLAGQECLG